MQIHGDGCPPTPRAPPSGTAWEVLALGSGAWGPSGLGSRADGRSQCCLSPPGRAPSRWAPVAHTPMCWPLLHHRDPCPSRRGAGAGSPPLRGLPASYVPLQTRPWNGGPAPWPTSHTVGVGHRVSGSALGQGGDFSHLWVLSTWQREALAGAGGRGEGDIVRTDGGYRRCCGEPGQGREVGDGGRRGRDPRPRSSGVRWGDHPTSGVRN